MSFEDQCSKQLHLFVVLTPVSNKINEKFNECNLKAQFNCHIQYTICDINQSQFICEHDNINQSQFICEHDGINQTVIVIIIQPRTFSASFKNFLKSLFSTSQSGNSFEPLDCASSIILFTSCKRAFSLPNWIYK